MGANAGCSTFSSRSGVAMVGPFLRCDRRPSREPELSPAGHRFVKSAAGHAGTDQDRQQSVLAALPEVNRLLNSIRAIRRKSFAVLSVAMRAPQQKSRICRFAGESSASGFLKDLSPESRIFVQFSDIFPDCGLRLTCESKAGPQTGILANTAMPPDLARSLERPIPRSADSIRTESFRFCGQ